MRRGGYNSRCLPREDHRASTGKALKSASATYEIYRYDAAHAFFNERSAAYDLASANQAWDRMLGFLEKRL